MMLNQTKKLCHDFYTLYKNGAKHCTREQNTRAKRDRLKKKKKAKEEVQYEH